MSVGNEKKEREKDYKKEGKKKKKRKKTFFWSYHLLFLHTLLTYVWFGIKVARRRLSCELGIESGK